jgi:predicted RNase H-like HicB family nuclease
MEQREAREIINLRKSLSQMIGRLALRDVYAAKRYIEFLLAQGEPDPDKGINVSEINEPDLRPVQLSTLVKEKISLILKLPLEIEPEYDEEAQEITFCLPELNIIAAGPTREEAIQQLQDDVIWLWQEYGEAPSEGLSLDALDLKSYLQDMVEEARRS